MAGQGSPRIDKEGKRWGAGIVGSGSPRSDCCHWSYSAELNGCACPVAGRFCDLPQIRRICCLEDFKPDKVQHSSHAASHLCTWVHAILFCTEIHEILDPKKVAALPRPLLASLPWSALPCPALE